LANDGRGQQERFFSGPEELSSAGQILQERDETYKQHVRWPSKKVDLPTSLVIEQTQMRESTQKRES